MKLATTTRLNTVAMKTFLFALMLLAANTMFGQLTAQNNMLRQETPSTANLDRFTAAYDNQNGIVKINWVLTSQETQAKLVIEKSTDGVNYIYLGKIPAIASSNKITYSCRDNNPAEGSNFYRIKAVNAANEEFIYEETAHVNTKQPVEQPKQVLPLAEAPSDEK